MTRNGYNVIAGLALVCGAVVLIVTGDKEAAAPFVLVAGTVVGRGTKA